MYDISKILIIVIFIFFNILIASTYKDHMDVFTNEFQTSCQEVLESEPNHHRSCEDEFLDEFTKPIPDFLRNQESQYCKHEQFTTHSDGNEISILQIDDLIDENEYYSFLLNCECSNCLLSFQTNNSSMENTQKNQSDSSPVEMYNSSSNIHKFNQDNSDTFSHTDFNDELMKIDEILINYQEISSALQYNLDNQNYIYFDSNFCESDYSNSQQVNEISIIQSHHFYPQNISSSSQRLQNIVHNEQYNSDQFQDLSIVNEKNLNQNSLLTYKIDANFDVTQFSQSIFYENTDVEITNALNKDSINENNFKKHTEECENVEMNEIQNSVEKFETCQSELKKVNFATTKNNLECQLATKNIEENCKEAQMINSNHFLSKQQKRDFLQLNIQMTMNSKGGFEINKDKQNITNSQKSEINESNHYKKIQKIIFEMLEEMQNYWHLQLKKEIKKIDFLTNIDDFFLNTYDIVYNEIFFWRQEIQAYESCETKLKYNSTKFQPNKLCLFNNCKKCSISLENLTKRSTCVEITYNVFVTQYDFFSKEIGEICKDNSKKYRCLIEKDFSTFYQFFMDQQKKMHKILHAINVKTIRFKSGMKAQILGGLFHNFKLTNLKIKLILIPEFFSLLIQVSNINISSYIDRDNALTLFLFFYLQRFNNFFDALSYTSFYINIQNQTNNYKKKMSTLSLFIRINLIEPLLILIIKQKKVLHMYCFHTMNTFVAENLIFFNSENVYIQKNNFLQLYTWCICIFHEEINSLFFLDCYDKNEIYSVLQFNYRQVLVFSEFVDSLLENFEISHFPKIQNDYIQNLRDFQNIVQNIYSSNIKK